MPHVDEKYLERVEMALSTLFAISSGLMRGLRMSNANVEAVRILDEVLADTEGTVRDVRLRIRDRANGDWANG